MTLKLYQDVLATLEGGKVREVKVGLRWTAVVVEREGELRCGLSTTLDTEHEHTGEASVPGAGNLTARPIQDLAGWITSDVPIRRSIGCAAINALLRRHPERWVDDNAVNAIRRRGAGKKVVLIGHFPFVPDLRQELDDFTVLDHRPIGQDLPAQKAPDLLPEADVVAITGMTFINRSLGELLSWCKPDAYLMLLGPTTPLSPVLHDYGVDMLAGSVVRDVPSVLEVLTQAGNFRQVHQAGVQLVLQTPAGD